MSGTLDLPFCVVYCAKVESFKNMKNCDEHLFENVKTDVDYPFKNMKITSRYPFKKVKRRI